MPTQKILQRLAAFNRFVPACLWFVVLSCCPVRDGQAAQREVTAKAAVKVEYNDNISWVEEHREDNFVTTISPELGGNILTERTQVRAAARLSWIRYRQRKELDNYDARLDLSGSHSLDPRSSVDISASWQRDTRIDSDFTETGLLYDTRERQLWNTAISLLRSHTELSSSRFGYRWQGGEYTTGEADEVRSHQLDYSFSRALDERLTLRTFLTYGHHNYDTAKVDNLSGTLGGQWRIDEKWDLSCDLGVRWTRTQQDQSTIICAGPLGPCYLFVETLDDSEWGGVLKTGLTRKMQDGSLSLNFSRDLQTASGTGNSTERTGINLNFGRRFNRFWSGRLMAGYFINKTVNDLSGSQRVDEQSLSLGSALRYELNPNLAFDLSYRYSRNDDDVDNSRVSRNLVFLQLLWSDSLFSL